jgi:hypothetical protein
MKKILAFLKKSWMQILNYLVVFVAYSKVYEYPGFVGVELILGLWLFILTGYYIFWKLFKAENLFKKKTGLNVQPERKETEFIVKEEVKPEIKLEETKPTITVSKLKKTTRKKK